MATRPKVTQDRPALRVALIETITTPLGFFVLAILVVEALLAGFAYRAQGHDFTVLVYGIVGTLVLVILVFAGLMMLKPEAMTQSIRKYESTHSPTLGSETVSQFYTAIGILKDQLAKELLEARFSNYAKAWAGMLEAARTREHGHDKATKLCFDCFKRLFRVYFESLRSKLNWRDDSQPHDQHNIRISADAELFFSILHHMLEVFHKVHTDSNSKTQVFAWAVTNALPSAFYHWGDDYGKPGYRAHTDDFRNSVRKFVESKQTYQRIFLLREGPEGAVKEKSETEAEWGLSLKDIDAIREQEKAILVLATDDAEANPTDRHPLRIEHWRELEIWDHILEPKRQGLVRDAVDRFYGIIHANACEPAVQRWLGAERAKEWKLGEKIEYPNQRAKAPYHKYNLRPVELLKYFETEYHSPDSMRFLLIRDVNMKKFLPAESLDCLILGVKIEGESHPLITIASHIDLSSDTLEMEIVTSEAELKTIKDKWSKLWDDETKRCRQVLSIAHERETKRFETKRSAAIDTPPGPAKSS